MEYLDGQTLKQYLKVKDGKIPADELLRMMKPLIASLGKLHAQGLIHRDISPDNIMIMKDGSIKILDFGGARDFVSQNGKSMSVLVKHGYAPEEQYRSRGDQGPWTDVYALCATMYRCITGKIPPEALDRLYEDELKPISSFGVNCPRYVEQAISKGLSIRKDGRYQSMEELYDALYKGKPPKPPKPPEPPKPKNNKTKLIIAAVATAAVGIAVIAGVGIKMKQPDEKVVAKEVVTPTPEPTSTPETKNSDEEIVQTASGVNIIKQNATYYAMASVNVRSDCNAKDNIIGEVEKGQELTSTGVSQDGEWIEIKYNGQTGYIFALLVDTTKPTETTETKQSTSDTIDRAYVLDTSKELTGIHHAEIDIKNYGHIEVELDADTAPITVKNFVKLAQEGFYDGVTFWRIMDGFMIQGGDPTRTGKGGSDETIKGEFGSNGVENAISHTRGTISMARSSDPDSASSQFFIVQSDSTFLDGDYAAFGHVTEGMDVVDQICKDANPTDNNGTIKADEQPVIESIQIKD